MAKSPLARGIGACLALFGLAGPARGQAIYAYPYSIATLAGAAVNYGFADGEGPAAKFRQPAGMALDSSGNLYVADTGNHAIRMITPAGVVSTIAGAAGIQGSADGPVASATFNQPWGVTLDPSGNVYVADTGNSLIRVITPSGQVTTLAGGSISVQDGTGSAAGFSYPKGIAYDAGCLYVTDTGANLVRQVTLGGVVTTLAGGGATPAADGTGAAASFSQPVGIVAAPGNELYVADSGNKEVRAVSLTGQVTTIPNTGGDYVMAVAADAATEVYYSQTNDVREITIYGTVASGLAGQSTPGSNDGMGLSARFNSIAGMVRDGSGNLYVADSANNLIRKISPAGQVTTLAGAPASLGAVDGPGSVARFNSPCGVAVDSGGNVYVVDPVNETIRKITPGGQVSTLAGSPGVAGSADGTGAAASFNFGGYPSFPAVDGSGNIYVSDVINQTIRKVTPAGVVTTLAGGLGSAGYRDGQGSFALFSYATAISADAAGNLYVADGSSTVRKVTPGGLVSTVAGQANISGHADGTGTAATFWTLKGIACDHDGNLYVCDSQLLRKITPAGVVTTVAGQLPGNVDVDGLETSASFISPMGVAADSAGNVFVSDWANNIRVFDLNGRVSTVAGQLAASGMGAAPAGSADGVGAAASFNHPDGIAVDGQGNLYVADSGNNTIRKGAPTVPLPTAETAPTPTPTPPATTGTGPTPTPTPATTQPPTITVQPQSQSANAGATAIFWVGATGTPPLQYEWSYNGSVIPNSNLATWALPDLAAGLSGSFSVRVSNAYGQVTSAGATLTVLAAGSGSPPTVSVQPTSQTVAAGQTVVFTAAAASAGAAPAAASRESLAVRTAAATAYQWFLDGAPLVGAVNPTLQISQAGPADNGDYSCLISNADGAVVTTAAYLDVVTTTNPGHIANISCRAGAGTGANTLIAGFVLSGGSAAEPFLIRASGPALTAFGVTGALPDPLLTLYQAVTDGGSAQLGIDENWSGNVVVTSLAARVGAFPWTNPSSDDSALVENLAAGAYTAQIAGASGDSGVALAEVYDAPTGGAPAAEAPQLVNVSARVHVGSAPNILIAGFVIEGSTSITVLVRASGPALKGFGVTGTLPDPMLQLYRTNADGSSTLLASDTGWGGDTQILATAAAVGAFSWGTAATPDSALLMTLPPGAYTAQVSGASGDAGVALVEVYYVQ